MFGRYPASPDGDTYPVLDLVICHGDFLNADHEYVHRNKSVKVFGSYGDLMIRDRKMYVTPTPFHIASGVAHLETLVLPDGDDPGTGFKKVGNLVRMEAGKLVVGYSFDLRKSVLTPRMITNPSAGRMHRFSAWRLTDASDEPVHIARSVRSGREGA